MISAWLHRSAPKQIRVGQASRLSPKQVRAGQASRLSPKQIRVGQASRLSLPAPEALRPRLRRRGGFTLYEVLVATVIIAVGLVMVLRAVGFCLQAEQRAKVTATVSMLAREKMEEIRKEPRIAVGDDRGDFGESFPDDYWEAEIRQTAITGLDQVIVTVHYTLNGAEQEYVLSSLQIEDLEGSEEGGLTSSGSGGGAR